MQMLFEMADAIITRNSNLPSVGLFLAYQIGLVDGLFTADPQWSPK